MTKRLWLVRLGRHGEREDAALENNMLGIGFGLTSDLTAAKDRDAILEYIVSVHPNAKMGTQRNYAAQVNQFVNRIQVGDIVVSPLKKQGGIAIAEVTGPYVYDGSSTGPMRPVKWLRTDVPRDTFKQDLLYSFGAIQTVCEVSRNDALNRVLSVANGGVDPGHGATPDLPVPATQAEENGGEASTQAVDLSEIARNQIEARISSIFTGHELTALVAAILEAQGYVTHVSPPGPDGGYDIVAGRGALGFDAPRLVVQVKSGNIVVDHPTLQSLNGLIQDASADHGLIVSWSGFKHTVRKETNRQYFRVRFWGRDELIDALLSVYDDLPEDIRAALPLKRIWTLVPEDDEDAG
ncbi:restriction endonuclease [Ruegeria sp.]|uniref:restriction endonuclease n=1 Tax=Ruegeria sp. TaxID=1879320 RepID=UPI003AFF9858